MVLSFTLAAPMVACRASNAPARQAVPASGLEAFAATYRREAESLGQGPGLYLLHPQAPRPPHFVDLRNRKSLQPGPVRARMFAFGFGYPCDGDRLVQPDGTICPGAAYPGATLSDAQTARAAEILRTSASSWNTRARVQCFDPHHAIVLFDEREAPIGELTICFECNNFRMTPGPVDEAEASEREAAFFADTCRELRVGACPPAGMSRMPDLPPPPEARKEPLQPPMGLPTDRLLRDMTRLERDLLCAWADRAMRFAGSGHYACGDGRKVWIDDADGCKRWPPSACDATVGDVVSCTRSRVDAPCGAETPACISVNACHWGMLESTATTPPR